MKTERIKRYALLLIGLLIAGTGVGFTKVAALGVSPISSVPNVMSLRFPVMTIGNYLIIWNCLLIAAQAAILRKNFKPFQLFQIVISILFGYFTDFGVFIAGKIPADIYPARLAMSVCGVILLGFGITLTVIADIILNAGEAFVKVLSDTLGKDFSSVKVVFDVSNVLLALILSLVFFGGKIVGMREGTVIAAVGTGFVVKFFTKLLKGRLNAFLSGKSKN